MQTTVNFKDMSLSLRFDGDYHRLALVEDKDHTHLPFVFDEVTPPRCNNATAEGAGNANKPTSQYSSCRLTPTE